jgi:hypothetical protein
MFGYYSMAANMVYFACSDVAASLLARKELGGHGHATELRAFVSQAMCA